MTKATLVARVVALEERVDRIEGRLPRPRAPPGMTADELRVLREASGLSLRTLSDYLAISHVSLREMEIGKIRITEERAQQIRSILKKKGKT